MSFAPPVLHASRPRFAGPAARFVLGEDDGRFGPRTRNERGKADAASAARARGNLQRAKISHGKRNLHVRFFLQDTHDEGMQCAIALQLPCIARWRSSWSGQEGTAFFPATRRVNLSVHYIFLCVLFLNYAQHLQLSESIRIGACILKCARIALETPDGVWLEPLLLPSAAAVPPQSSSRYVQLAVGSPPSRTASRN